MPLVKVTMLKGKSSEYKKAVLDGVHAALVEAFRIPDHDRNQQLYELDRDCFEYPSEKSDTFMTIEVIAFLGRSFEAKKNLYAAIVRNLGQGPGIDGDDILIIIHEPPMENWGIRGGMPASEVDIGFRVDV